ncbi:unnamed protein product [Candida verbasci]|uniref:F-box domain-containing protein n=1 Tax=Candida verbasci TaxID=1227364 RepID=A0A9W4U0C5_9ASCO|nr:unnamed protein product [Candida verbasci]
MRKYQLIGGKGKLFQRKQSIKYPDVHLHSLPVEILLIIFGYFQDNHSLIQISLCCKKFNQLINKYFLYNVIVFKSTESFYKFSMAHLLTESSKVNYITSIEFLKPQLHKSSNLKLNIAGSYAVESNINQILQLSYNQFISSLINIFTHSFGLKSLSFLEISPDFAFQTVKKNIFKKYTIKKRSELNRVVLKSQSGWSIPLKASHLSLLSDYFEYLNELHLTNFIIDSPVNLPLKIRKIIFQSCSYKPKKQEFEIFTQVFTLELKDITNDSELSLIDLVKLNNPNFNHLIIDISSSIFYDNNAGFKFSKFNPFFKLLCSSSKYSSLKTITLYNFDLFNNYFSNHDDIHSVDSWVENLNTFDYLIKYISNIPKLNLILKKQKYIIKACAKCGFKSVKQDKNIENLTFDEWEIYLKPLNFNKITITKYNNDILYTNDV